MKFKKLLTIFTSAFISLFALFMFLLFVIWHFILDLPDHEQLINYEPPMVTRVYASNGRLISEYAAEQRSFVPLESIPDIVKNSFLAAEDKNFYSHFGIDFTSIIRAAKRNINNIGGRPEGASTITQQVAKNFFLTREVSYKRKIKEILLALRIEQILSKDRILTNLKFFAISTVPSSEPSSARITCIFSNGYSISSTFFNLFRIFLSSL